MQLTALLAPETRVLEVGVRTPELAGLLAADGVPRYLGLAPEGRLGALRSLAPASLHGRLQPLHSPAEVVQASTDLLVLRAPFGRLLWSAARLQRVRYVAVEVAPGRPGREQRLASTTGRWTRRLRSHGRFTCGDEAFDVFETAGAQQPRVRHHLSPAWGVPGFVERLRQADVSYVVLRWFEDLPRMEPGEDLDMLVSDADLETVHALLSQEPGTIPVDLYSATGLPGSDYRGVAYYPPLLARRLLSHAVEHSSGARVPCPEDHLRSLAFHAVYHKGLRSGLPSTLLGRREPDPEHDYAAVLQQLAAGLGERFPETLEGVDEHLDGVGWRPPADTLRRLAAGNAWIAARFGGTPQPPSAPPEPAVFLLREHALTVLSVEEVLAVLEQHGFEVFAVRELDGPAAERCATQLRGGNWARGPFPVSGGVPALVVVAVHYGPRPPDADLRAAQPRLANAAVLDAKLTVRDLVGARVEPSLRFNALHSSDDEHEAWEYVDTAVPEESAALRAEVERRRADYLTDAPVLRQLSLGRRAKVELVDGADRPVVRKTFAPGAQRHLARELQGLTELRSLLPEVPELLDVGATWFTSPYYSDQLASYGRRRRLLPLGVVREMVGVLRRLHAAGYDLVDAKPQNFLLDPEHGLKLIDFEFLHRYEGTPPAFRDSYCFTGPPPGFAGDVPLSKFDYDWRWRRVTGLSLSGLVARPAWAQHLERTAFQVTQLSQHRVVRNGRRLAGRAARRGKRVAVDGLDQWAERRARSLPGEHG